MYAAVQLSDERQLIAKRWREELFASLVEAAKSLPRQTVDASQIVCNAPLTACAPGSMLTMPNMPALETPMSDSSH